MRQSLMDSLVEECKKGFSAGYRGQQVHFAAVVKRNKVLAMARNYYGIDGAAWPQRGMIHAESAVLHKLKDLTLLRGAELFVWRVSRFNERVYHSDPCPKCSKMLDACILKWGLRRVTYSV